MSIKNIKLKKGMSKDEVNGLISEWVLFEDDIFLGYDYKHNWKCLRCGKVIESNTWGSIRNRKNTIDCGCVKFNQIELKYRNEVEREDEYQYIRSFRKGDTLPNGKVIKTPYLKIKHKYCGNEYTIKTSNFIDLKQKCSKCCGTYENSFAYHIEQELGLKLEDVWDFDKNTVNPYHIPQYYNKDIWIKCQKISYHGSYKLKAYAFRAGSRCPYCNSNSGKVHPKDSLKAWLIENNLFHLWSPKNEIDASELSVSSNKYIWMLCEKHMYHNDNGGYRIICDNFTKKGVRCSYCGTYKVHPKDSFGSKYPDKAKCWHKDNNKTPYEVAPNSYTKYKFSCFECGHVWSASPAKISSGTGCPRCNKSKGEKKIINMLKKYNIDYINDKPYFNDLFGLGGLPLRPDFILPDYKIWIEYDGEFHYRKMYDDDGYETTKEHDKRKDEYAKKNGWKLIRIPYWEFDNIENILEKELKESR